MKSDSGDGLKSPNKYNNKSKGDSTGPTRDPNHFSRSPINEPPRNVSDFGEDLDNTSGSPSTYGPRGRMGSNLVDPQSPSRHDRANSSLSSRVAAAGVTKLAEKTLGKGTVSGAKSVISGKGGRMKGASKAATGAAKSLIKKKIMLYGTPILLGIIAVVFVFLLLMSLGSGSAVGGEGYRAMARVVEESNITRGVMSTYSQTSETSIIPWEILAAAAQVSTDHGRAVPDDEVRRRLDSTAADDGSNADEGTTVIPVAEPPIIFERDDDRTFEGVYLLDMEYIREGRPETFDEEVDDSEDLEPYMIPGDFDVQRLSHSTALVAEVLTRELRSSGGFNEIREWHHEDYRDFWLDAIRALPVAGNSEVLLPEYEEGSTIMCTDDREVIVVGDSLTVGIQEFAPIDNVTFIAYGGWTVREGINRLQTYLEFGTIPGIEEEVDTSTLDPARPKTIVINLGTNGWGSDDPQSMLEELLEIENAEIILVKPRPVEGRLESLNAVIRDVRDGIEEFLSRWSEEPINTIDAIQAPIEDEMYESDGVHLTGEGYRVFSGWLANAICGAGLNSSPVPFSYAERVYYTAMQMAGIEVTILSGSGGVIPGINETMMMAYQQAVEWADQNLPECGIDIPFLAAVGYHESGHGLGAGRYMNEAGLVVPDSQANPPFERAFDRFGNTVPEIYSRENNGDSWVANDLSREDLAFYKHPTNPPATGTHALGPMQQLPKTWSRVVQDNIGPGHASERPSPHNAFDAARGAAYLLCRNGGGNLRLEEAQWQSANSYSGRMIGYADKVLAKASEYRQIIIYPGGRGFSSTSKGVERVIAFAHAMIGSGYAQVDPYRFGDPLWPGGILCSGFADSCFRFPAGTRVFDCSGFIVAAYREVNVDLGAIASSNAMVNNWRSVPGVRAVSQSEARPGDILAWKGHAMLYLGNDNLIHSSPACRRSGSGVCTKRGVEWNKVEVILRVTIPEETSGFLRYPVGASQSIDDQYF